MNKPELIKLDSGLNIIACLMPHMRSVSTVIGIKAGSIYESKKQQGISHFIEHMLFKGTQKRKDTLEISQCIEQLGGEINASTSEECTFLYSKVLYKNFENAFEVMSDIINYSLFKEEDIIHEKSVIIEEINKYQDIPEDWISVLINQLLWNGTVLAQNVLGEKETVRNMDRTRILNYYDKMYNPKNIVISVAGNITPEAIWEVVKKHPFNSKKIFNKKAPKIQLKEQGFPELITEPKKVNQTHLCFGFEGISRFHPEKVTMDLLNILLGAGLSSRLFQEIRVKEALAYDIHSYTQFFDITGSFNIYAGVDPGKMSRSIEKVLTELKKLKDKKIDVRELQKAKEMYKGSILLGLENTLNRAFRLGSFLMLYNKEYQYKELIDKIEKVTPENIRSLSQKLFLKNKINLVIFYPNEIKIDNDDVIKLLEV
ncbi:MAG: pitrilysin family protein [Atribacterota bacterium]|nr:pitrilysin family protein [Atribacterota bacterium]